MNQTRISPEFQHVSEAASADVEAVLAARGHGGAKLRKVRVQDEDNAPCIPPGAVVAFRPAPLEKIRPGRFVLFRRGSEILVRRLISTGKGLSGVAMRLATYSGVLEPPVSGVYYVGEVVQVEAGGRKFDPAEPRGLEALRNFWTDFNTCSPLAKVGRLLGRGA